MTWFLFDGENYNHALREIPKQRDRGAAMIATAILEDLLVRAIQGRIDRNDKVEKKMFRGYGPLASLSAKIDLGLLLGLYPETLHRRMHAIRNIRNNFAHSMHPISFRSQKSDCAKLNPDRQAHKAFNRIFDDLFKGEERRPTFTMFQRSHNPRTQFIRAVQQVCSLLTLQIAAGSIDSVHWEKSPDRAAQPSLNTRQRLDPPPI